MQASTYDALEGMRARLIQLTHSLSLFHTQLTAAGPGPTVGQIQSQFHVLQSQFQSLAAGLVAYEEVLSTTVVYPHPSFPVRQQENLLLTLLRRKLTLPVENWIESATTNGQGEAKEQKAQRHDELFAAAAGAMLRQRTMERRWDGRLTMEERNSGETDQGENEDDGFVSTADNAVIDQVLLFMSSGKR